MLERSHDTPVLVLWGHGFDEAAATLVVTELRRAAQPVKLVGMVHGGIRGAFGLTLHSDLTLDAALPGAAHARALIAPCGPRQLAALRHDPRLSELLDEARRQGTLLVTGEDGPGMGATPCESLPALMQLLAEYTGGRP